MTEKIIDLLKKVKKLSEEGATDGERNAAKGRLDALLKKYNISLESLSEEQLNEVVFTYKGKEQKSFLFQIVANVIGKKSFVDRYSGEYGGKFFVRLTKPEEIDISEKYTFYWNDFNKKMKDFKAAYIHANDLGARIESDEEKERTIKELKELLRILKMAASIEPSEFYKKIGN